MRTGQCCSCLKWNYGLPSRRGGIHHEFEHSPQSSNKQCPSDDLGTKHKYAGPGEEYESHVRRWRTHCSRSRHRTTVVGDCRARNSYFLCGRSYLQRCSQSEGRVHHELRPIHAIARATYSKLPLRVLGVWPTVMCDGLLVKPNPGNRINYPPLLYLKKLQRK